MKAEKTTIWLQVQPNANRNELLGFKDGAWQLKIAAPPVKGRANQELIGFLSDILSISKSNLTIEKGFTSKQKAIGISGLTLDQVREQLGRLATNK